MSKHTSDDDSDIQVDGPLNWKEHESLNKDVFLMSAKELMNMPHLDI